MKVRSGFVSNSSSSSFIVAYRSNFADDFKNAVADTEKSPFAFMIQEVGACFKRNIDETFKSLRDYFESEDYDKDRPDKKVIELLEKGFIVATGSISDENYDGMDSYLAHVEIEFENDSLAIYTEGGY